MSIKVYDGSKNEEFQAMQYHYPATKEFKDFVGVKSYAETYENESANGKSTETAKFSFTFDDAEGKERNITLMNDYWFFKNENDWQVCTPEGFKEMKGVVDKIEDVECDNKDYENYLIEKILNSRDSFVYCSRHLADAIERNMSSYENCGVIDSCEDNFKATCENLEALIESLDGMIKDIEDDIIDDDDEDEKDD